MREVTQMTKLNFAIAEIVDIYNFLPKVLAPKVVKVAVHPSQSNRDRPSLAEQKNGNYWIVLVEANYWLLPQSGLRINQFNLATVKSLFDCQGYELSEHGDFVLLEAAQVSGMPNGTEWRLEKKGVINFDPNYPAAELRSQQKQAQQEIDRLQSELEESKRRNQRLNAQLAELAYDTLQKIRADLVTRDEFIEQSHKLNTFYKDYQEIDKKISEKFKDIERKITQENFIINDRIAYLLALEKHNRKTKDTKVQEQYDQAYQEIDKKISEKFKDIERKITQENRIINDRIADLLELEKHNRKTKDTKDREQYDQAYQEIDKKISEKFKDIERKITQENRIFNDRIADLELEKHNRKTKDTKDREQKEPTGITTLKPSEPPASQTYQSTAPSVSSSSHSLIEVSPTEESLANREMGGNDPIVLKNKRRGIYEVYVDWKYHCLVPSQNFRINQRNYKSVEDLFECQNYDPNYSDSYTVIRPAVVYPLAGGQAWQLQQRGVLRF
jgi:hypothetical protein